MADVMGKSGTSKFHTNNGGETIMDTLNAGEI